MKYFTRILLLLLISTNYLYAQLPNGSFENWATNQFGFLDPVDWDTFNYNISTASQFQPAQNGTYGLKLTNDSIGGQQFPGIITCYFHNIESPASMDGYYFGHFEPGDVLLFSISIYDTGMVQVGNGFYTLSTDENFYTHFSVPITYTSSNAPDTAIISISLNPGSTTNLNGFAVIDYLTFPISIGVNEINNNSEIKIWPNPTDDFINVSYPKISSGENYMDVTDLNGRIIFHEKNFKSINTSILQSGLYFIRIISDEKTVTRMFTVLRN